jgi:hypothetical protein
MIAPARRKQARKVARKRAEEQRKHLALLRQARRVELREVRARWLAQHNANVSNDLMRMHLHPKQELRKLREV